MIAEGPEELPVGTHAGEHVIESILGRGGFAIVYLATRPRDGQRAAVKVLSRKLMTPNGVERFLREIAAIQRVRHPNIVEIHDHGRLPDDRPYYTMELLEGAPLDRLLEEQELMTPAESLPIIEGVCAGLAAAHAAGVVHRDLKAENVIVGRGGQVKLVDFGIAKLLEPDPETTGLTTTGNAMGTLYVMAPEQLCGQRVDQRTDIYALGVLLYLMLTGAPPFCGGSSEQLERMHLGTPPRPPSELAWVSPPIDAAVLRCLEKTPAARFPDVGAFLEAYRAAVDPGTVARARRSGVAILVRVEIDGRDEDAGVEAMLALDTASAALRDAGYTLALETSCEVLGARLLPVAPRADLEARRQAVADARRLHDELLAGCGVRPSVTVHCDQVDIGEGSKEIIGGRLLELGGWGRVEPGVSVTASAAADGDRRFSTEPG
jgi:serine/threonine-protein kinase